MDEDSVDPERDIQTASPDMPAVRVESYADTKTEATDGDRVMVMTASADIWKCRVRDVFGFSEQHDGDAS